MNRKISSGLAIGIILILTIIVGSLIYFNNKEDQVNNKIEKFIITYIKELNI